LFEWQNYTQSKLQNNQLHVKMLK